jgi:RNA polymerase sigma-70 factor, ECF subfamily
VAFSSGKRHSFGNYERWTAPWRLAVGSVDGEPAVLTLKREGNHWKKLSAVRLHTVEEQIVRIVDYGHCPWLLGIATSTVMQ